MKTLPEKTTVCPCGFEFTLPIVLGWNGELEYGVCECHCPKCGNQATGGNYKLGTVDSWMSRRDVDAANDEYARQMIDADNNMLYGRGNW